MPRYYVRTVPQNNGDHEVHEYSCTHLPAIENRLYLGEFATCKSAVTEAKKTYPQSNGCYWCSNACHTS